MSFAGERMFNHIWFQRQGTKKAYVTFINDAFCYEIFETNLNQRVLLQNGSGKTLPEAKKEVFQYFLTCKENG